MVVMVVMIMIGGGDDDVVGDGDCDCDCEIGNDAESMLNLLMNSCKLYKFVVRCNFLGIDVDMMDEDGDSGMIEFEPSFIYHFLEFGI